MYQYPTVAPGYGTYTYTTSPSSSEETHGYYPPPQYTAQGAHARPYGYQHPRRESFPYAQVPPQQWYSPPGYQPAEYYVTTPTYTSQPAYYDAHVSSPSRRKSKSQRFFWGPGASGGGNDGSPKRHASKRSKPRINVDVVDEAEDSPPYSYHTSRPAYYHQPKYARADPHFFYYQEPVYAEPSDPQPKQQRARRPSESKAHGTPSRPAENSDSRPKQYRTRRPSESKAHATPSRPAEAFDSQPKESRARRASESKPPVTPSRPAEASDSPPKESRAQRPSKSKTTGTWSRPSKSAPTKPTPDKAAPAQPKPAKTTSTKSPPAKPTPAESTFVEPPPAQPHRQATAEEAARAGIPAGYTTHNWDPDMRPMLLLGSAFDAHTLGKWIFDWTVSHYSAGSPIADIAGHIWILILKLAVKTARAQLCLPRVRSSHERAQLREFVAQGEEIWGRFDRLVAVCEEAMWRTARRGKEGKMEVGGEAGRAFVETMFGRDGELEEAEVVRDGLFVWDQRFDDECGGVLRRALRR